MPLDGTGGLGLGLALAEAERSEPQADERVQRLEQLRAEFVLVAGRCGPVRSRRRGLGQPGEELRLRSAVHRGVAEQPSRRGVGRACRARVGDKKGRRDELYRVAVAGGVAVALA